jgi:cell division protein FtsQ
MRVSRGQIWRRRVLAALTVGVLLAAAYLFWFRNSSLFDVNQVEVKGVTANAPEVAAALDQAAQKMTTLHVREEALTSAVSRFPTVAALTVHSHPPHKLEIDVIERVPVATVRDGDAAVPVSGDGFELRGVRAPPGLPPVELSGKPVNGRLSENDIVVTSLLAAAPAQLESGIDSARYDAESGGAVADLSNGIELRLGDASDAAAKWAAAATLLAAPDLGSPAYIDVSVPERPVSGGYSN